METRDSSATNRNKLLSHHWDLNSSNYHDQISFLWKNNEIRIEIHSFCNPSGRNKCIHFDFFINGEHTLFKFQYNCYGGGGRGKTPELLSEDYRITFHASTHFLEVYEEKIKNENDRDMPTDRVDIQRKDVWISVFDNSRSDKRYDAPL